MDNSPLTWSRAYIMAKNPTCNKNNIENNQYIKWVDIMKKQKMRGRKLKAEWLSMYFGIHRIKKNYD